MDALQVCAAFILFHFMCVGGLNRLIANSLNMLRIIVLYILRRILGS